MGPSGEVFVVRRSDRFCEGLLRISDGVYQLASTNAKSIQGKERLELAALDRRDKVAKSFLAFA